MGAREPIRVRVNDEFVLDAGTCEAVMGPHGHEQRVHPPDSTLFRQVLTYLRAKPTPPQQRRGPATGIEGLAAAAVALRWGSYLAVLVDRDKPVSPVAVQTTGTSRISDDEMARINIEASAALAEWIDISRADDGGREYQALVHRAIAYLPMTYKAVKVKACPFMVLANPEMGGRLVDATDPAVLARVRVDAERNPTRLFANALVNVAWRNGPVEDVHAGSAWSCPLDQRRVTPDEEAELMRFASERMATGMTVCGQFAMEQPRRPWVEQVLPFGLAQMLLVTPTGWTLTETSREVRLSSSGTSGGDGNVIR